MKKAANNGRLLFLTGARGSGKTTVGQELSNMTGLPFQDLDEYIGRKENRSIADIVEKQGWEAFRSLEQDSLRELSDSLASGGIIATGGGVILLEENRRLMREKGLVLWLRTSLEVLLDRLAKDLLPDQRPSLTGLPFLEEIRKVTEERQPLYKACAHQAFDGDRIPSEIGAQILEWLRKQ